MTLRTRLSVLSGATVAVVVAALSLTLYLLVVTAQHRDLTNALNAAARQQTRSYLRHKRLTPIPHGRAAVLRANGRVVAGYWRPAWPSPAGPRTVRMLPGGGVEIRRMAGGLFIGVWMGDHVAEVSRQRLLHYLLWLDIAAVAVAWSLSYWVGGRALAPLRRVAATAAAIVEHQDLSRRLGLLGRGELGALGDAFDRMLDWLEHALGQLHATVERERRFTADAAHVLRNPLTAVIANLDYLTHTLTLGGEQEEALRDASHGAQRLLGLTQALLRLARGESVGRDAEVVALDELVAEVAATVARSRGRAQPEIDLDPVRVRGDRDSLYGMIEGVVDNAYKYSRPPAPVAVRLRARGGVAQLAVEDRGAGISEEALGRVFERFYRGGEGEGHGLGLAIAQAVARAHGGRIWIASQAGRGTSAHIELPAVEG